MTPQDASKAAKAICQLAPIVPVIVIDNVAHAAPLAEALVSGGLPALEVTLRTPEALPSIREMAKVKGGVVGAGTILSPEDVVAAKDAGAQFGVSPGASDAILDKAEEIGLPMLPAGITPTEIMRLLARGYTMLKFFPAEASGGVPSLKSFSSPLSAAEFCPTGGITLQNAKSYFALPNVICCGGSWVAPKAKMDAGEWAEIEALAREAATLGGNDV